MFFSLDSEWKGHQKLRLTYPEVIDLGPIASDFIYSIL